MKKILKKIKNKCNGFIYKINRRKIINNNKRIHNNIIKRIIDEYYFIGEKINLDNIIKNEAEKKVYNNIEKSLIKRDLLKTNENNQIMISLDTIEYLKPQYNERVSRIIAAYSVMVSIMAFFISIFSSLGKWFVIGASIVFIPGFLLISKDVFNELK